MPFATGRSHIRPIIEPGSRWIKKRLRVLVIPPSTGTTTACTWGNVWDALTKDGAGNLKDPYATSSKFNLKVAYAIIRCKNAGQNFQVFVEEDLIMQSVPNATQRNYDAAAKSSVSYAGLTIRIPTAQQLAVQIANTTSGNIFNMRTPAKAEDYDVLLGVKIQI